MQSSDPRDRIVYPIHKLMIDSYNPSFITKYRKVPKFSDRGKLCCNLPKIQTKRPKLRVFREKGANRLANSEDPDQTAPLEAV